MEMEEETRSLKTDVDILKLHLNHLCDEIEQIKKQIKEEQKSPPTKGRKIHMYFDEI